MTTKGDKTDSSDRQPGIVSFISPEPDQIIGRLPCWISVTFHSTQCGQTMRISALPRDENETSLASKVQQGWGGV